MRIHSLLLGVAACAMLSSASQAQSQSNGPAVSNVLFRDPTPPCGSTFDVLVGDNLTFTVLAADLPGETLLLDVVLLPPGATMTPDLPTTGNPVTSTFSWTPVAGQEGSYTFGFRVSSTSLKRDNCPFTVNVLPCSGSIGDFLWDDLDADGLQDPGEPGLDGVTVALLDDAGSVITTTVTGPNGLYQFSGLCAGTYTVAVDPASLPPGYVPTGCNAGADDTIDNDCSPFTVTLPTNDSTDPTIDFGYTFECQGSIGDFVWEDLDRDGIQDAGEPGIQGVAVLLKNAGGSVIDSAVTRATGFYQFAGQCAGTYEVEVVQTTLPPGLVASPCNVGADDTVDNDCSLTQVVLATDFSDDPTNDFGYNSPCTGTIGDFVWNDVDCDGLQDAGEPGLAGIKINLKDGSGTIVGMTTTGMNGAYSFSGLCAGDYTLEVDPTTLPPNFIASACDVGGDDTIDNDCSPVTVTLVTDGSDDPTVDFGYKSDCIGTIGDFVWNDLDRDGLQDAGEPGIQGVTLLLEDAQGNVLATAITDGSGFYEFTGLCAGTYTVVVDPAGLPPGLVASPCNAGADDTVDNDCSPVTVTLPTDTSEDETIDFGYNTPCSGTIGDFVFEDLNGNNVQDAGEPGIEGVVVQVKDAQGTVIAMTTTDATGFYQFVGLCAGTYKVEFDPTTVPGSLEPVLCDVGSDDLDSDCAPVCVVLPDDMSMNPDTDFGFGVCAPCSGGVTELTLRYSFGALPVFVEVLGKDDFVVFSGNVNPGDAFTFFPKPGESKFTKDVAIVVDGVATESLHTSCSQPIGPGIVFGDFEVIAARSVNGGLICNEGDNVCKDGKPKSLTMIYTGKDCTATSHSQDASKVNCSGDPAFEATVQVLARNDNGSKVWFNGLVNLGEAFELDASNAGASSFDSATFVDIFDLAGNLLQAVEFHTSCSQPLSIGDEFGALALSDFCPEGGFCAGGAKPKQLLMTYTGDDCTATSHSQDAGKVNCSGDPGMAASVQIVARNDNGSKVWFSGTVDLGDMFVIDATQAAETKLENATFVDISDLSGNLLQTVEFHTSCSQTLAAGDQFGGVRLEDFIPE